MFSGLVVESLISIRKTGFCACGSSWNATFVGDFGELLGQLVVRDFSGFSSMSWLVGGFLPRCHHYCNWVVWSGGKGRVGQGCQGWERLRWEKPDCSVHEMMKTKRWNIARAEIWWCWGWLDVMCSRLWDQPLRNVLRHNKSTCCARCKAVRPGHSVQSKLRTTDYWTDQITIFRCFLSFKTVV